MVNQLLRFVSMQGLPPHGFCLLWNPALIWLHATSDGLIGFSYFAIPLALARFVRRRRDLAFGWIFWMFAAFILACGTTHFMAILTIWYPAYGLEGLVKAVTAVASVLTAVMFWPLVSRAMVVPTPAEFRRVSAQLARTDAERDVVMHQLRQTEESFRLLVSGVTDYAIFMLDPGGVVSTWNAGAERIKGYRRDEILGRHFSTFYTPEDRDAGLPTRALAIVDRDGRYEAEGWRVRKNGTRFWASVVIDALRDESGRKIGYAKVTRDITERCEAALALEQTRAALAQAQKMETIGQLAGGVAHDFNNVLTAILGGLSLIERRLGNQIDGDARRIFAAIGDSAGRAAKLTHQLLAFSRKQVLAPQVVDANRLIGSMSDLLRHSLNEHIELRTVLTGGLWRIFVDANQLENALLNLAVNARDAMPDGGRLTLETGNVVLDAAYAEADPEVAPGEYVLVAVSDTGIGMPDEVRAKVFEPFFTTKPAGQGTGLGLSQVFGFVKQSGGQVKIYSVVDHGTTVKIYLPRHRGDDEVPVSVESTDANLPGGKETVLLVEDDDNVRQYVASSLKYLGYRVSVAANGRQALDRMAEQADAELLLTDVGLPGLNGRQLAELVRQRAPAIKVVFMTAYAPNAVAHHGVLDPGVNLLPKPFTVQALARKLRDVLDANG